MIDLMEQFANRDAERKAMQRARRYVELDPFYEGKPLTSREEALMMLALRAMTAPSDTDIAIAGMVARATDAEADDAPSSRSES